MTSGWGNSNQGLAGTMSISDTASFMMLNLGAYESINKIHESVLLFQM